MPLVLAAPVGQPKLCQSPTVLPTTACASEIRLRNPRPWVQSGEEILPYSIKFFCTEHARAAARPVPLHDDDHSEINRKRGG